MTRRMIFGIDVDDVLLELVRTWIKVNNSIYNDSVKYSDIKTWDIASYTKFANNKEVFYSLLNDRLYKRVPVVDGALFGVNELRKVGRVIFVTSNFANVGRAKYERLNELGFAVDKRDYFECEDKSLIRCHYLIDDNPKNVMETEGVGVLYNRPWNESIDYMWRVSSWKEIVKNLISGGFQS